MNSVDGSRRELILRVATGLFAALGYDSTSTSQIAEAAGLSVENVGEEFGSKRGLYLEIMENAYRVDRASLERALEGASTATPEQTALVIHRIVDHYLDLCLAHPEFPSLWMHRWLSDAGDITELERTYIQPLLTRIFGMIVPATAAGHMDADADMRYAFWSVVWCVHGFCRTGVLDEEGNRQTVDDPAVVRRFRVYLHQMVHRVAALPGSPPAP
ncbi:TetR/AcrR family transcriptional regulator [Streptosporangium sp. NPDC048865]|uniref:TetR/AcrR family transcriptional regulator n=1 Tax=Streptosporangium sp. NPDC048865 TaxID=3155766 RepID=UPI00341E6780